ncbi:hypothetical protein [Xylophilus sp. GOD-11R]|uniref:hypothetical protein n=1 Tax=Xylophilus sp. GOD-11R TaxID=3089814 RepID=UPI00298CEE29|nr:hypothetical protein [Xylophilus sp. GOD-11R]WPB56620.1 hypothetical protein R9X41_21160 [Xylophilus sp. GOD-11R]
MSLGACALVEQQPEIDPSVLSLSSRGSVAVGVHDERPEVVSGARDPSVVGVARGGLGQPFDIATGSERPLAEDIAMP